MLQGLCVGLRVLQPLEVKELDVHAERVRPLAVKDTDAHPEWEADKLPVAASLHERLRREVAVDDPKPLNEVDTVPQGLCVGLRVLQPLAVKEPDALAERVRPLAVKDTDAHPEWEADKLPVAASLHVGLRREVTVDDPQPLNVAVTVLEGLCVRLRVLQPLAVKEPDALAERVRPLAVKDTDAHPEWEADKLPVAASLHVGLRIAVTVDDPQPLKEAVTELQGLCVGLRVPQALAVKDPDVDAERDRPLAVKDPDARAD